MLNFVEQPMIVKTTLDDLVFLDVLGDESVLFTSVEARVKNWVDIDFNVVVRHISNIDIDAELFAILWDFWVQRNVWKWF